jgi:hypothetical protein
MRESAFVHHVRALRRLVATAGPTLGSDAIDSVVVARVRHVLTQMADAEAAEVAEDFDPDPGLGAA